MILGPDQIIACPHCKGLAKYSTLLSGNNMGTRVWTDGKQIAPMLPRPTAVVKCHQCTECYWLVMAEKLGTVDTWSRPVQPIENTSETKTSAIFRFLRSAIRRGSKNQPRLEDKKSPSEWSAAAWVVEPAEEEYYTALQKGLAQDSNQERTLRILAWQRRNDPHRNFSAFNDGEIVAASGACRQNLEALTVLLSEADESDLLMKAEVLRELGEFALATESLHAVTSSKFSNIVRQIHILCVSKDPYVRELRLHN
jgi:hypothetical protein